MKPIFSWTWVLPDGMDAAVLLLFCFAGAVSMLLLLVQRHHRAILPGLIHVAGGILAALSADLITLLVAWEILTFSAFFLLLQSRTGEARRAASLYLVVQIIAAALYFVAALLHFNETGTLRTGGLAAEGLVPAAQPFMALAVLIKTAGIPFHFWLVRAYPVAALPITPLLSAFTTKVGVVTAARLVRFSPGGVPLFAWAGALTALVAVVLALRQHQVRRLLSYHLISQVGYMTAAVGMAGMTVDTAMVGTATRAGLFHLVTHTLYKALLFMVAAEAARSFVAPGGGPQEELPLMGGLARKRPILCVLGVIGAAAISGVPFTSGYASKELLKHAVGGGAPGLLLQLASVGTGLSFLKFLWMIFWAPAKSPITLPSRTRRAICLVPAFLVAVATVLIGLRPTLVPGIDSWSGFSGPSLGAALLPLGGSLLLWVRFRARLVAQGRPVSLPAGAGPDPARVMFRLATEQISRQGSRLAGALKAWHRWGPQSQLLLALATVVLLGFLVATL
ncbi:multicomponent Na+:H+ antiporter subunit D [Alkalispirochaeta americana]|uniref:Multicomponent Na+:H+ antiporter subunit D n=1 Tax=Alkalispirochaeta americana TaxID=159291 RepID=A0A1N6TF99_9SPIO|nr:proton-conducting transporter membrane subunit [Alkalispirochaeta americana]SIQ52070.1 multicomponent Na+:H+ antiporter subunit D [Alkalispirochaeta americana]